MRILIIEDEPDLARAIADAIREAGMATDIALDGEEGLHLAVHHAVDAVILDRMLPKLDGLVVLRGIKKAKPTLPVLVLTALDRVAARVEGLDSGADDYLVKPFAIEELLARVRALLRRASASATSAVVKIDDLEIDLAAHLVRRAGRTIDLTPREYALLVFFANNVGKALDRTTIGEHVIDREFESTSNLIDVSIHGLRHKLGAPDLIHTVRGVGYRLATSEDGKR